ncbi:MAG: response regulator [Chloroflexota bacterium]
MIETQTRTALLLDDDRNTLVVLQSQLVLMGWIVTAINHPSRLEETLERLDQIDIIFLDLEMPVANGFQVLKQLREMDIDAPVVAHTVHVDHLNKIRREGFDAMVAKPLNLEALPNTLERIIAGEAVWQTT